MSSTVCTRVTGWFFVLAGLACGAGGTDRQSGTHDWDAERRRMVDEQLWARVT